MTTQNTRKLPVEEIKELVDELVEEKILLLLHDPDENKQLRKGIKERLRRSLAAEADGEKGILLEDINNLDI
jgi:hypothetical protein